MVGMATSLSNGNGKEYNKNNYTVQCSMIIIPLLQGKPYLYGCMRVEHVITNDRPKRRQTILHI